MASARWPDGETCFIGGASSSRPAGLAADHVQVGHQSQDRGDAQPHNPAIDPVARGMVAVVVGNVMGAGRPDEFLLLGGPIIEGVGFFGVVLGIPSMLAHLVRRTARDTVMAVWSAYMPAGIMLMLFAGPLLPTIGW